MLRPATPLSILLFISFVLLLLSVLSAPIVRSIPIGRYQGINFGVFGYCRDNGECSSMKVGYKTDGLFPGQTDDFNLSLSKRHSLASILVVHPIAAFCNLIVLALAVAAHFHSPSHSARYLLGLLILLLPTLLVTLLAFLVDILLFVPHVQWGGWIVLASTVLIALSGVVTCGMRRTLVSRKARKKRIQENAEMNGENYYARQEHEAKMAGMPASTIESKTPLVHGSPGADKLPSFTTYDTGRPSEEAQYSRHVTQGNAMTPVSPVSEENRYYSNFSRQNLRPAPMEPTIPYSQTDSYSPASQSRPSPDSRGPGSYPPSAYGARGGYGPPRGRGGPPRGAYGPRGGYGPRGPPPPNAGYGRGGYGPDVRGGYYGRGRGGFPNGTPGPDGTGMGMGMAMGMMAGPPANRRPPPPGYPPQNGNMQMDGFEPPHALSHDIQHNPIPYNQHEGLENRSASPSQYSTQDENPTDYVAYNSHPQSAHKTISQSSRGQSPAGRQRSASPPPEMPLIGQAVELDATNGRAGRYDPEVQGMVDLQRGQGAMGSPHAEQAQEYIGPRSEWNNNVADIQAPAHHTVTMPNSTVNRPRGSSNASGSYYEDVDPRFAESMDAVPSLPQNAGNIQPSQPLLHHAYNNQDSRQDPQGMPLPRVDSYEDLPIGARSPAESETSHFTSVSQRGVNPNWRPGNGGEFNNLGPRRAPQARQDMLLANNPDFELVPPPARFGGRGGRGGFRGGPIGAAGGMNRMPPPSALAASGDSPYPGPVTMREI